MITRPATRTLFRPRKREFGLSRPHVGQIIGCSLNGWSGSFRNTGPTQRTTFATLRRVEESFDSSPRVAALRQAWKEAAEDLAIRVVTDGAQMLDPFGEAQPIVALLPDFGRGMHIFDEWKPLFAGVLWERHQGFTTLYSTYEKYDRAAFIDALCDWGWTADGAPPSWYVEREQTS